MPENIADLYILVLDCQATGANPQQGDLLEIGWAACHPNQPLASVSKSIETHILSMPAPLPKRIKRITGISDRDIQTGQDPQFVWMRLRKAAMRVARRNQMKHCPVVIHFARYEAAFLEHLQQRFANGDPVRFRLLCTHQISRKLLPGLPRKGLRAVAGFLGHTIDPPRRSAPHVAATYVIWRHFLPDLTEHRGLRTFSDLEHWLQDKATVGDTPRKHPLERATLETIPDLPGVYRFLRANGEVLYIGKSKSLNRRVRSYFHHRKGQGEHILEMISQAKRVTYSCTDTALEAALCESDAIKQSSPPYNQALQIGHRHVSTASWQLPMPAGRRRRIVTIGPVPEDMALKLLPDILVGYRNPSAGSSAYGQWLNTLADSKAYLPPPDTFNAAIELFHLQYCGYRCKICDDYNRLLGLGLFFWDRRLREKTRQADELDPDEGRIDTDPDDWTPQQGLRFIESSICRAAHLIRRAQWFGLLANAVLSWQPGKDSGGRYRTLVIQEGHIAFKGDCTAETAPNPPCCHLPSRQDRQSDFSVGGYDRMRVLTTELKRIIGEGRSVMLQLGRRRIDRKGLAKTLRWL